MDEWMKVACRREHLIFDWPVRKDVYIVSASRKTPGNADLRRHIAARLDNNE
jgi:hypothetical protein